MTMKPVHGIDARNSDASAFHGLSADGAQVAGIGNLRVLITKAEGTWFAQGLEIDYAAEGDTLDDVKREFETGLRMTLHEHIKVHRDIKHALRVAPPDVWAKFLSNVLCGRYLHSQVSVKFPVDVASQLDFYEQQQSA